MKFDPKLPIILKNSPELDYAIDCGIADRYKPNKNEIEIYSTFYGLDEDSAKNVGKFNSNGFELCKFAMDKGWKNSSLGIYKKTVNWFFDEEAFWSLMDFTKITPLSSGEVFSLPNDIENFDIFSKKIRLENKQPYKPDNFNFTHWSTELLGAKHSRSKHGNLKNPVVITTLWNKEVKFDIEQLALEKNKQFPIEIPDFLDIDNILNLFLGYGGKDSQIRAMKLDPIYILKKLRSSELNELITTQNFFTKIKESFEELLLSHGIFIGNWYKNFFKHYLIRNLTDLNSDIYDIQNMLNQTYKFVDKIDIDSNKVDEKLLFENLAGHIFWQLILDSVQNDEISFEMKKWVDSFSETQNCMMCSENFSPILIHPRKYYGSNGNTLICLSCVKPKTLINPSKSELTELVDKFIESCGFIPNDSETPLDRKMTSRISHRKQIEVIKSWCDMGTIETIKHELGLSWIECLNELGLLPEGTKSSGRGIRCFGNDNHLCNSLSEKYIDDYLFENKIEHSKEPIYPYDEELNKSNKRADWKIGNTYVEYFGLVGDKIYDKRIEQKYLLAKKNRFDLVGIFPEDIGNLDSFNFFEMI